ncbi:hypothetical protein K1Y78_54600 [Streptomyces sp. tea 10]|nr:hypothetical protein [Streptomyces sp. tea 10]
MGLVIVVCMGLVTATAASWAAIDRHREAQLEAQAERNNPGARVLDPAFEFTGDPNAPVLPQSMRDQWVGLPQECSGLYRSLNATAQGFCRQMPEVRDPDKVVAVVGNSHMEQYMGALIPVAEEENWQLISVLQPGCGFGVEGQSAACREGNEAALEYLKAMQPDVVVTTSTRSELMSGEDEHVVTGLEQIVQELTADDITVVGFRDNPRLDFDPTRCAQERSSDDPLCSVSSNDVLGDHNPAEALETIPGFVGVDPTPLVCPRGECVPVIGNVAVWLDSHHLTWDYTRSMAPLLHDTLVRAVQVTPGVDAE